MGPIGLTTGTEESLTGPFLYSFYIYSISDTYLEGIYMSWCLAGSKEPKPRRLEEFWQRPDSEFWPGLILPEEDLPPALRGGPHRWFRPNNVVCLQTWKRSKNCFLRVTK
jgi:hypothetical protein